MKSSQQFQDSLAPKLIQNRLFSLAVMVLGLLSILYSTAPIIRLHSLSAGINWYHWGGFLVWLIGFYYLKKYINKTLDNLDPYLLPIISLLSGLGLIFLYRLDPVLGLKQTLWMVIGIGIVFLGIKFKRILPILKKYKYILLLSGILLAALTLFIGIYPSGNGPNQWLNFGILILQPSEPLKILIVIFLAAYLSDNMNLNKSQFRLIMPAVFILGVSALILYAQRDFGTAILYISLFFLILYFAFGQKRILIIGGICLLLAAIIGVFAFDIIQSRVSTWLNPWIDPGGNSYQIIQSLIAMGNGGFFGRGIGLGYPTLIPVVHSDFTFAAIVEETGFIGGIAIIFLYLLLFTRGIILTIKTTNPYHRLLAGGITIFIVFQSIFIIAGNLNLLPLSGITLPFVSYGGSSLVTVFFGFMLLILVNNQVREEQPIQAPIKSSSIKLLSGIFIWVFIFLSFGLGYWSIIKSDELTRRPDNFRNDLADYYVERGNFLDRSGEAITQNTGESGNIERNLLHTPLSTTIGYSNIYYGKAGLELFHNDYLRGTKGLSSSIIWGSNLTYGQPPEGLDIRLSIDLDIQKTTDELLEGKKGAAILLNSDTGEILTIASHPYFEPESMDENWEEWMTDENAPLLNRATQGSYPPGSITGLFYYTEVLNQNLRVIDINNTLNLEVEDQIMQCSFLPETTTDIATLVINGCPGTIQQIANLLTPIQQQNLLSKLFNYDSLEFPVDYRDMSLPEDIITFEDGFSEEGFQLSPLQIAIAAASINNGGKAPEPLLDLAVNTPTGWVILSDSKTVRVFSSASADQVLDSISSQDSYFWHSSAIVTNRETEVTWLIAGTNKQWQGSPLVLVIVLEEKNPEYILAIGTMILEKATIDTSSD